MADRITQWRIDLKALNTQIVLLNSSKTRLIEIKQLNNGDARESRVYPLERIGGKTKGPLPPSPASKDSGR